MYSARPNGAARGARGSSAPSLRIRYGHLYLTETERGKHEYLAARTPEAVRGRASRRRARYSSASEYVRELIRADEKRKAGQELEAKLLEGLNGPESELTAADWKAIRREALTRIQARSKSKR